MTRNEILRRFPKATESFIQANLDADATPQAAVVERDSSHAPLAAEEVQRPIGARFLVRITSVRKRLLDEDNLCEKYHVDLCRYAGVIPDDAPDKVKIEVSQRKAQKGERESVFLEVMTNDQAKPQPPTTKK